MGTVNDPRRVKLFVGLITSMPSLVAEIEARLPESFGPIDLRSGPFPFDSTHYYDAEMGFPLQRYFFGFSTLIDPEQVAGMKIVTNKIEAEYEERKIGVIRPINLDPGYVEESKIVLASTKNFYHRILISQGIYAEVTMHFETGSWQCLPWTFPDFRTGRYHPFFTELRRVYRAQLKSAQRSAE